MIFAPNPHKLGPVSDCRMLFLEMEFQLVGLSDLLDAAVLFTRWIRSFQNNQFITDWSVNNRHIKEQGIEQAIQRCKDRIIITAEGIVKSNSISSVSSMRKQYKQYLVDPYAPRPYFFSTDYPDYFRTRIAPHIGDDASLKEAILQLFQENGKCFRGNRSFFDSGCIFAGGKHETEKKPELYFGKIIYWVSAESCGRFLDEAAEELGTILLFLGEGLKTANGRIGTGPWATSNWSPYMTYFGDSFDHVDGSHLETGLSPGEWYPVYYACGIEWMNYLSGLPAGRIRWDDLDTAGILSSRSNDGVVLKLDLPVSKVEPRDLARMKCILSPVLFPGKSTFDCTWGFRKNLSYSMFPRRCWEAVPLSEDELQVKNTIITFSRS